MSHASVSVGIRLDEYSLVDKSRTVEMGLGCFFCSPYTVYQLLMNYYLFKIEDALMAQSSDVVMICINSTCVF